MFIHTSDHYQDVAELMRRAGQTTRTIPTMPTQEERLLRARLTLEEALEKVKALGFRVTTTDVDDYGPVGGECVEIDNLVFTPSLEPDLVEIADGCADILVIATGTLISCGIPDSPLLRLVDANNLTKFGPGGHRREDGKWVKPPGHQPPDVKGLLERLSREGP